jgi:tellurium resistance protein TerD
LAVRVLKGQEIDVTKNNPGLNKIKITLGWNIDKNKKINFDFDSSVFLCNDLGKAISSKHFIFYNNKQDPSGSVIHHGDYKTGEEGEEEIVINLEKLPSEVYRLVFAVSIHEGKKKKQSFGQVENSYLKILDEEKKEELIRFDLKNEFSNETGIIIGSMYKKNEEWKFKTEGLGFPEGLRDIVIHHGLM